MKGSVAALAAMAGLFALSSMASAQGYRLCALREGPQGPCTCEVKGGVSGEYVTAPRSRCRGGTAAKAPAAAPGAQNAPATAESPAAASPAAAAAPAPAETANAPVSGSAIETGGLPSSRKILEIRSRGKLLCGINPDLLGFSKQTEAGTWVGLDADFCRAVAATVFGDASKVEFVPVDTASRFDALKTGKIDLLARNTTWTMDRDVALGLEFAGILYIDGQGFMTSDERGLVSAQQLAGLKVCVESGTTSEANAAYYFKSHDSSAELKSFPSRPAMMEAYGKGECDAVSGDRTSLFAQRAGLADPEQHAVLPEVISKEPLGPVVLQDDREWIETVRWTLAGLINAEEVGLSKDLAAGDAPLEGDQARLVEGAGKNGEALGLAPTWLRDVVKSVGNYGEIFEADLGKGSPLGMERGINALWKRGGVLYAPPMW
ncbi:MAG: amino acid ABC transporter substrate-binding protein [Deltaproteobacteria bacterium]